MHDFKFSLGEISPHYGECVAIRCSDGERQYFFDSGGGNIILIPQECLELPK